MYAIRYLYASGGGDALNIILLTLLNKDNKSKYNLIHLYSSRLELGTESV